MTTTIFESESDSNQVNVLTKEKTLILDVNQQIDKPELQRQYLERLRKSLEDEEPKPKSNLSSSSITNFYALTAILNRNNTVTIIFIFIQVVNR